MISWFAFKQRWAFRLAVLNGLAICAVCACHARPLPSLIQGQRNVQFYVAIIGGDLGNDCCHSNAPHDYDTSGCKGERIRKAQIALALMACPAAQPDDHAHWKL